MSHDPMCSYVLPLRRWKEGPLDELAAYLEGLPGSVEVLVVDGSEPLLASGLKLALPKRVRHLALPVARRTPNGKVGAVAFGIERATHEAIVLADDDVRYDSRSLDRILEALACADIVRPQNYFSKLPWHARWDSARSLFNRLTGGDWPGTMALRRSTFLLAGGYASDVLFENYELVRAIRRAGGHELHAPDIFVRRLPPDISRFLDQRVRQAYDEFARPHRMAAWLAVAPLVLLAVARRKWRLLFGSALVSCAVAEAGRRKSAGTAVFPPSIVLFAPLWVAERAICSWLALWRRFACGGVRYAGITLKRAAS